MPISYGIDRRRALERQAQAELGLWRNAEIAMEMHQFKYFLTLCEELNFTRAAERCRVAQPALARAIKLLEEEFGGLLFHRELARTHLSELGQAVRPCLAEVRR